MTTVSDPSFETGTGWTFTHYSVDGWANTSTRSAGWSSAGSYSHQSYWATNAGAPPPHNHPGDYCKASRSITVDSDFTIRFDYHIDSGYDSEYSTLLHNIYIKVYVNSTSYCDLSVYGVADGTTVTDYDTSPITGLSGTYTLDIGTYWHPTSYGAVGYTDSVYIDNIRIVSETGNDVIYIDSTGGNDGNSGRTSGSPKQTFASSYAAVSTGGLLSVLDSTADFSGETVTLNKSFSIDLNGGSGYWYGPKAA